MLSAGEREGGERVQAARVLPQTNMSPETSNKALFVIAAIHFQTII